MRFSEVEDWATRHPSNGFETLYFRRSASYNGILYFYNSEYYLKRIFLLNLIFRMIARSAVRWMPAMSMATSPSFKPVDFWDPFQQWL